MRITSIRYICILKACITAMTSLTRLCTRAPPSYSHCDDVTDSMVYSCASPPSYSHCHDVTDSMVYSCASPHPTVTAMTSLTR